MASCPLSCQELFKHHTRLCVALETMQSTESSKARVISQRELDGKEISISFKFLLRSLSFLHTGTSPAIVFKFQLWNRFDAGFCCIISGSVSNTDAIKYTCTGLKRCSINQALQELGKDLQDSLQELKSRMLPYTGNKMTKAHREV